MSISCVICKSSIKRVVFANRNSELIYENRNSMYAGFPKQIDSLTVHNQCILQIEHVYQYSSHRLLDSLVVQCWFRVREVAGSIPSLGPPPRQPSGRVLAASTGGPGFNPQSRTASSIAQWQSVGFECGRSWIRSPVKDRVIPKTLQKWYQQFPCLAVNIEKGNTGSFSRNKIRK